MIIPTALPKSLLSFFLFSSLEATAKRNLVPLRGLYCPKELDAGLSSKMSYMEGKTDELKDGFLVYLVVILKSILRIRSLLHRHSDGDKRFQSGWRDQIAFQCTKHALAKRRDLDWRKIFDVHLRLFFQSSHS